MSARSNQMVDGLIAGLAPTASRRPAAFIPGRESLWANNAISADGTLLDALDKAREAALDAIGDLNSARRMGTVAMTDMALAEAQKALNAASHYIARLRGAVASAPATFGEG